MGLVTPMACGIFLARPGIELMSPALASGFLITGPLRKCPHSPFLLPCQCEVSVKPVPEGGARPDRAGL